METNETIKILESIARLAQKIDSLKPEKQPVPPHRSEELNELFGALAKAQADIKTASESSENPYFKSRYANLAQMVKVSRQSLSKNGLSVIQNLLVNHNGQTTIHTILGHSSGQWIESRLGINPTKSTIQDFGSYVTYMRRYAYASLVGVVSSDEDDDGEVAMIAERQIIAKGTALNTKYNPKENKYESITKEQLEELEYELGEYSDIAEQVLSGLHLQSLADMPKSKFLVAVKRVREIKNLREGKN